MDLGRVVRTLGSGGYLALFELSFVSSLKTFRRRWTVNLYCRSCFKTNNDESRFSGTELGYAETGRPVGRNENCGGTGVEPAPVWPGLSHTWNVLLATPSRICANGCNSMAGGELPRERILIELMTSDRKLKASREGSK